MLATWPELDRPDTRGSTAIALFDILSVLRRRRPPHESWPWLARLLVAAAGSGSPSEWTIEVPSRTTSPRRPLRRLLRTAGAALPVVLAGPYLLLPWYARWGTRAHERRAPLPGDDLVPHARAGYTLAITIDAAPSAIWPWLVQMGQGRGGFYTHVWVERLLRADLHNAERIAPAFQHLAVGDLVSLTPDPYFGHPAQVMTVAEIRPPHALVFRQTLPNGTTSSWALVLHPQDDGTTRLLSRRRGRRPTLFDRVMAPGYVYMDRGVLHGIRDRVEARDDVAGRSRPPAPPGSSRA